MFTRLFAKFSTLADHHQTIIAVIIAFTMITITWITEQLLEKWLSKKETYTFLIIMALCLLILWLTKHYILHIL